MMSGSGHCSLHHACLSAASLARYAPHAALRPLPAWRRTAAGGWMIEVPVAPPALPAGSRVVPSLSLGTPLVYDVTFTLRGERPAAAGGAMPRPERARLQPLSGEAPPSPVPGDDAPSGGPQPEPVVRAAIDLFEIEAALGTTTLGCELSATRALDPREVPALLTVQVIGPDDPVRPAGDWVRSGGCRETVDVRVAGVPSLSQMEEASALRERICAPTSLAMVLRHHGRQVSVASLAALCHHPGHDLYGVWPMSIRAAARHGCLGYLTVFPDWQPVVTLLARGVPLVASIAYGAGELDGAAIPRTTGHLVTLTGVQGDRVLVHDPAAPTRDAVPRTYDLQQLTAAWLDRHRIAYVILPLEWLAGVRPRR
ncbi:MAG: C39 family peptidase [Candidatus Eiseniibacteriota bacterium]|jgi:hypothetical protein